MVRSGTGRIMRIAVTGASGNVGTALLTALTAAGHSVVAIARRPPSTPPAPEPERLVEWHAIDLTRSPGEALVSAFRGADAVVHLAWGFQPTHDTDYLQRLDIGGTHEVITAVDRSGVGHLLHMSSLGVYSPGEGLVDESHPREGVTTSAYSRHKAAAERMLDDFEAARPDVLVTRMRPVLIGQRAAASEILRYTLPALVPGAAVRLAKVLPCDRDLRLQLVHAADVAAAYRLAIEAGATGPFNLAAPPVLTPADLAAALGARHVHVPQRVVRTAADLSWRARLQAVDVGWPDMAWSLPQLDSTRATVELGWHPRHDGREVLHELVGGLRAGAHGRTPIMRRRTVADGVRRALTAGPVARRPLP